MATEGKAASSLGWAPYAAAAAIGDEDCEEEQLGALVAQALDDLRGRLAASVAIRPECQYTRREQRPDGLWVCPAGTADTGRTWGDLDGDKQCLVGCTQEQQQPKAAARPECRYTRRELRNNAWVCPSGTTDTGRTWGDQDGDKQCLVSCGAVGPKPTKAAKGKWKRATATYYTSYPECCHDASADQSECKDFSGCKYEGMFAAFPDKKPKAWVEANNIVAFYQAPNRKNRDEWDSKWKNKKLLLRNPQTGTTMEVTVVDTCDDDDCKGCCSANANKNGGYLVDLEYNTAKRFWGGPTFNGLQPIEWQVVS